MFCHPPYMSFFFSCASRRRKRVGCIFPPKCSEEIETSETTEAEEDVMISFSEKIDELFVRLMCTQPGVLELRELARLQRVMMQVWPESNINHPEFLKMNGVDTSQGTCKAIVIEEEDDRKHCILRTGVGQISRLNVLDGRFIKSEDVKEMLMQVGYDAKTINDLCAKLIQEECHDFYGHPLSGIEFKHLTYKDFLKEFTSPVALILKGVKQKILDDINDIVGIMVRRIQEGCYFTHGMIMLRDPPQYLIDKYCCEKSEDGIYTWEVTSTARGPRLSPWKKNVGTWLYNYKVSRDASTCYDWVIAARNIINNTGKEDADVFNMEAMYKFFVEVKDVPYGVCVNDIASAVRRLTINQEVSFGENIDKLFCTEGVAEAFQRLGALNEDVPSNSYLPCDFLPGRLAEGNTVEGIAFGPPINIIDMSDYCFPEKSPKLSKEKEAQPLIYITERG